MTQPYPQYPQAPLPRPTNGLGVAGLAKPAMDATHDFVRDVAAGDYKQVADHNPGWEPAKLQEFHDALVTKGDFTDTAFDQISIVNNTCHLGGTATFTKGSFAIQADLVKNGDKWEVQKFSAK